MFSFEEYLTAILIELETVGTEKSYLDKDSDEIITPNYGEGKKKYISNLIPTGKYTFLLAYKK